MATSKSVKSAGITAASAPQLKNLDIKILDREYKVACRDDEKDSLLIAAAYLDKKMREVKEAGKIAGTDRIAVMVALNLAHELLTAKTPGGFDIGEAQRTISSMHSLIDNAIASQEKLF